MPLTIPDHVMFRELDGEGVLLNLQSGNYFSLDEVGMRIWALLREQQTPAQILETLHQEYDAPRPQIEADLHQLLASLKTHGLLAESP